MGCLSGCCREVALCAAVTVLAVPGCAADPTRVGERDGLTYLWIAPGSYQMGCSDGDVECFNWEFAANEVVIEPGFWIGQTEVTQAAYMAVIGANPSLSVGSALPVERVSWNDARRYCESVGLRLPTEQEWEYAVRGGLSSSRYGSVGNIAWYDANSGDRTHPVAQKEPNRIGLYDTLGNVWEWVEDSYEKDSSKRILRGGSFYNRARELRVSNRLWALPETAHRNMGFRCAGD
jgi:formylglycine-generating enzyme required for sulfatase activity